MTTNSPQFSWRYVCQLPVSGLSTLLCILPTRSRAAAFVLPQPESNPRCWYRQVLCANSFTSLAELSLHRAGKPALNYLIAEDRERVKGGEAACEALDVNSVFCYQPASSSCISMYFMLMYFFPPHWVPAT